MSEIDKEIKLKYGKMLAAKSKLEYIITGCRIELPNQLGLVYITHSRNGLIMKCDKHEINIKVTNTSAICSGTINSYSIVGSPEYKLLSFLYDEANMNTRTYADIISLILD